MKRAEDVYVPDDELGGLSSITCPDCGSKIKAPWGGHTWTCHEEYGGCGAQFKPSKVFKRL